MEHLVESIFFFLNADTYYRFMWSVGYSVTQSFYILQTLITEQNTFFAEQYLNLCRRITLNC